MLKTNCITLLIILFSCTSIWAEEFTINKYEVALKNLAEQYEKAQKNLDTKATKSKQAILEKYYNDLEKHFAYQMRTKNLNLANKINEKKEKIFATFKETQEALKPKKPESTPSKPKGPKSIVFLTSKQIKPYSSSGTADLKKLNEGEIIFKKGGDYIGNETWKQLPKFLKGKYFTFMSHEKDSANSRAYFTANRDGYVYYLSTHPRTGFERVGKAFTSGGRGFHVYKYYAYEGESMSAYCRSSYETLIVFND